MMRRLLVAGVVASALAVGGVAGAAATASDEPDVISACVNKVTGFVRVPQQEGKTTCAAGEDSLVWNQEGRSGAARAWTTEWITYGLNMDRRDGAGKYYTEVVQVNVPVGSYVVEWYDGGVPEGLDCRITFKDVAQGSGTNFAPILSPPVPNRETLQRADVVAEQPGRLALRCGWFDGRKQYVDMRGPGYFEVIQVDELN